MGSTLRSLTCGSVDPVIRFLVLIAGMALVGGTLLSAVRTMVLPRSARSFLTAVTFRASRRLFRLVADPGGFARTDKVMALFAPMTLLALAGVWLALVLAGFTAIFWAAGYGSATESLWVSGSSLLTLGSASMSETGHRALGFTEAAIGLGLVALLISFLPSLYAAFSRREKLVALLEVRAGTPPSAVEMLERFERIGWSDSLDSEWERWEAWFVDIDESHTSYPVLVWLRSPQPERSWITAAGTALDAASLWVALVDRPGDGRPAMCIRAGYIALRRIADFFGIPFDRDPSPSDPISIARSEFEDVADRLSAAGVPVKVDRDRAWADFAGWRVNYDTVLLSIAELVAAPIAPWSSDRSAPDHARPTVTRWGRRIRD